MCSRIPVLALCAALMTLAVTAAAQAAPKVPKSEFRQFELVNAKAEQEVEWHWLDSAKKDDCTGYTESSGVERTKVDLDRPAEHTLMIVGPSVALLPDELVKFSGTTSRTFEEDIQPGCAACGGELGECGDGPLAPPEKPSYDCRTQKLIVPQMPIVLFQKGMEKPPADDDDVLAPPSPSWIDVDLASSADRFENCPPTHDLGPGLPDLRSVGVRFKSEKLRQLLKLKPGQTMRLQGKRSNGHTGALGTAVDTFKYQADCPPLDGPGLQVCDTLTVDVALKRVK